MNSREAKILSIEKDLKEKEAKISKKKPPLPHQKNKKSAAVAIITPEKNNENLLENLQQEIKHTRQKTHDATIFVS